MHSHSEQRDHNRFYREATIMIENYPTGKYFEGKMYNYSKSGMYFESDFAPDPGTDIFIGIEKSPFSAGHDVYSARVMWVKELPEKASFFYYGVGVKYY